MFTCCLRVVYVVFMRLILPALRLAECLVESRRARLLLSDWRTTACWC